MHRVVVVVVTFFLFCLESETAIINNVNGEVHGAPNSVASQGNSVLHRAASNGEVHQVTDILDKYISSRNSAGRSPLDLAVIGGHLNVVVALLSRGAPVNSMDNEGNTALHHAVERGDVDIISALLSKDADTTIRNKEDETPLNIEIQRENVNVVELLLNGGASVNLADRNGNTPLHQAVQLGADAIVAAILKKAPNTSLKNKDGQTPLDMAVLSGNLNVVKLLLNAGASPDIPNEYGFNALHIAAWQGTDAIVAAILEKNPNTSLKHKADQTPLDVAVMRQHLNVVKLLLNAGASPDIPNKDHGGSALHVAVWLGADAIVAAILEKAPNTSLRNKADLTPLDTAVLRGHLFAVKLLLNAGASSDIPNKDGNNALHIAARQGADAIVDAILEKKPNTTLKNKADQTPLDVAVMKGHLNVVKLLLNAEASANIPNNDGNNGGNTANQTPLMIAVLKGHLNAVKLLLSAGASANIPNKYGNTALHLAVWHGADATVAAILEKQTDTSIFGFLGTLQLLADLGAAAANRSSDADLHLTMDDALVAALLENGANSTLQNKANLTALDMAVLRHQLNAVKLLLNAGAPVNSPVYYGNTALHFAAWYGDEAIITALVSKGADTTLRNQWGVTPFDVASARGHVKVANELLKS
ncbi:hypothetical protein PPYR_13340 [Photinus pyralis]|uniref:Uncharacterized protein n=1 Tax=Photinus pyralis TaxID=7054 RepID=A0A1Y1KEV4_PHOPY|nr:ankyrin-1-like isoform X3 [Photinus pyralis]XP_031354377.1 ankyrin-1-like isoform X3 [Photinus pyralis]KAB0793720.1 hypothetical protein PPYR_13340 [Photinus pyralis]